MRLRPVAPLPRAGLTGLATLACLAGACRGEEAPATGARPAPEAAGVAAVRTSELQAGPAVAQAMITNPYDGDSRALEQGRRYYDWFNCTGCHGGRGGGGIGPVLADDDWIYGGSPAQIFESIVKGRPNGMPSFGAQIPEDRLWMIVAYVESLSEAAESQGGDSRTEGGERQ